MIMDLLPIWALFAGTVIGLVIVIEIGYQLGSTIHRRSEDEKESPVGAISAATLGLLAFMLAFTFGITTERYETRKTLVREEANAAGTLYLRTDFLAEPDRTESQKLIREYLDDRVALAKRADLSGLNKTLDRASQIQRKLWGMAVTNAKKDLNSDIGALYIESLNQVIDIHALRLTVALQTRIPSAVWVVLYLLVFFGMISIGYQTGIAGSRRTLSSVILAVSFGLVLSLIVMLDRTSPGAIAVSQQPLINARAAMDASPEARGV